MGVPARHSAAEDVDAQSSATVRANGALHRIEHRPGVGQERLPASMVNGGPRAVRANSRTSDSRAAIRLGTACW